MPDYSKQQIEKELKAKELDPDQFSKVVQAAWDKCIEDLGKRKSLEEKVYLKFDDKAEGVPYKFRCLLKGFETQKPAKVLERVKDWLDTGLQKGMAWANKHWAIFDPNVKKEKDVVDICGVCVSARINHDAHITYAGRPKPLERQYSLVLQLMVGSDETNYKWAWAPGEKKLKGTTEGIGVKEQVEQEQAESVMFYIRPDDRWLKSCLEEKDDKKRRAFYLKVLKFVCKNVDYAACKDVAVMAT
ncbi:hypothetical protein ACFL59_00990 [Planctomycetota bacterium]